MLAATPWSDVGYRPTGVTVVVPLPMGVIHRLKERAKDIENSKNDYMKAVYNSGRAPFGVPHHKLAGIFLKVVIFQDFVPSFLGLCIEQCLELTTFSSETSLERLGIHKDQVLLHVAGFQIVLLDLQEAVSRADFYTATQRMALQEMASRDKGFPKTSPKTSDMSTTTLAKSSLKLTPTRSPERCANGANCRSILNGQCGFFHTKEEIAEAGAIVEELIGISTCRAHWIVGPNGSKITDMAKLSGADIWIEDEVVRNNVRILHVVGSREAVNKAKQLIMQSATGCHDETQVSYSVEELIGTSTSKAKLFVGENGAAIKEMAEASGANIWLEEDRRTLHVKGNREALAKGVHLVLKWAAQCDQEIKEGPSASVSSGTTHAASSTVAAVETSSVISSSLVPTSNRPSTESTELDDDATWPALVAAEKTALSVLTDAIVPSKPPANRKEDPAWPILQAPTAVTSSQQVSSKPAIQSASKTALSANASLSRPKVAPFRNSKATKKIKSNGSVAKVSYKHPCIHGAKCQYIQSGRDECKYFHSTQEIEQAAARNVEHVMYISPAVVGWIIGKKGTHLKELMKKSGTEIWIDQESMRLSENRIMYINGKRKSVDKAIQLVKKALPDGQDISTGPGVSTETTASTKSTPNVNRMMYIAPAITGWVIGKNGKRSRKVIRESGAEIWIDQESMGPMENRIIHVSGTKEAVDVAIQMVTELLPDGFGFEPGPGITSSAEAESSTSSSPKATATASSPPRTPPLRAPSPDPVFEQSLPNLISPPQPIRRPRVEPGAFMPSGTSVSSGTGALVSEASRSTDTSPTALSYGHQHVTPTAEETTLVTPKSADTLLGFLQGQAACLKGSPEAFYLWLSSEDINNIDDLVEAVGDDDYLRDVLQHGNGTVGVKGFRRNAFKKAAVDARSA